ncbi:MAG: DUF5329 family protein [Opitutaceae bacterium]
MKNLPSLPARIAATWCTLLTLICLTGAPAATPAPPPPPTAEIEALLRFVAALDGATFIRNGDAHSPKEAEAHLRLKWGQQKKDIRSAEDFIRLCAAKSSLSGKPYSIKFKDGHEEEAAVVLSRQLKIIRTVPPSP